MGGRFRLKTKVGNLLVPGNTGPWPGARSLVLLCDDPDARNDVESLKDIDIDYVIPLHCTGELFYEMAKAEMPSKLLRSYTGTRFVFGD